MRTHIGQTLCYLALTVACTFIILRMIGCTEVYNAQAQQRPHHSITCEETG